MKVLVLLADDDPAAWEPTGDIARLFLVSTPTMAARLTRARRKLAAQAFALPPPAELGARATVVAEVAYLAFTAGYAPTSGPDVLGPELAAEAIRLVRVVRAVLDPTSPGHDELDALLALMLLQHARPGRPGPRRPAGAATRPGPTGRRSPPATPSSKP